MSERRITTTIDLLTEIMQTARLDVASLPRINNSTIVGDHYEGLTRDLVTKSLFAPFDLRVCSGVIRTATGEQSSQIDCMVVVGDGTSIPYTPHFIYDISQVVAVVEVTKTLSFDKLCTDLDKLLLVGQLAIADPSSTLCANVRETPENCLIREEGEKVSMNVDVSKRCGKS